MDWAQRIRRARAEKNMTRAETVEKMQSYLPAGKTVTVRTLLSWETGQSEPRISNALALAKALGYREVSELFSESFLHLNLSGIQRLEEYRQFLLSSAQFREPSPVLIRRLPVYLQPASAGTGQWLDDETAEMMEVDASVPSGAAFGVRLAGDSMEPRFANGQIVWIKKQETASDGQIVLCILNGQAYCKKLVRQGSSWSLNSFNRQYAPICIQAEDAFQIFGIVVG